MTKTAQTYTRIYINGQPIELKEGDTIEYQEDDFEVVTNLQSEIER